MKITFIGAAHEVTGSCTLLENGGKYYLVDKGMEQGVDMFENVPLPVAPEEISAVFITHAHIDHTGMLPKLYKDGYRGPVYATSATCSLCNIMLLDSAHIQESEAEWRNRKATRSGDEVIEPLYTAEDLGTCWARPASRFGCGRVKLLRRSSSAATWGTRINPSSGTRKTCPMRIIWSSNPPTGIDSMSLPKASTWFRILPPSCSGHWIGAGTW